MAHGTPSVNPSAIETLYAGCRFRSRLEARWAVFFDTLGIRWEYEPQGFEVSWRLLHDGEPFAYLPDFLLPDFDVWVEVKGSWTSDECHRFLNAAAYLSAPQGGCGGGRDVTILGPVPTPPDRWSPILLHMHKGDLDASPWCIGRHSDRVTIARDVGGDVYGEVGLTIEQIRDVLLRGWWGPLADHRYAAGLTAARSARFEHGETPTPPKVMRRSPKVELPPAPVDPTTGRALLGGRAPRPAGQRK